MLYGIHFDSFLYGIHIGSWPEWYSHPSRAYRAHALTTELLGRMMRCA